MMFNFIWVTLWNLLKPLISALPDISIPELGTFISFLSNVFSAVLYFLPAATIQSIISIWLAYHIIKISLSGIFLIKRMIRL